MYKYFDFRYFSILESILKVDPEFLNLIKSIADNGNPVGSMLNNLINKDIKTNTNYLKTSDKNDDLKFVNDTQVKRIIDAGENPFDKATNITKIGRAVRQILNNNNISVTDQEIEKFVNLYKNIWDKKFKKENEGINLVSGEDIRNWYHHEKYVPGGGQLNNSCMRYDSTQEFLNLYTENKEVCQLVILVNNENKLLGRALLWKLIDGGYYLDRVYTRYDSDMNKFYDWYKEYINATDDNFKSFISNMNDLKVQLKKYKFKYYPYMDSLYIIDYETGILGRGEIRDNEKLQLHIQSTDGIPSAPNHRWSDFYNSWLKNSESVYISYKEDYYLISDSLKDYKGNYIYKEDAIYSEYYKSYIISANAVEVEGFGLVDSSDVINVYDSIEIDPITGMLIDKKEFLRSKLSRSNYVKTKFRSSYYWINKNICYYDTFEDSYFVDNLDRYTKLYKITTKEYDETNILLNSSGLSKMEEFTNNYRSYGLSDNVYKYKIPFFHLFHEDPERSAEIDMFATEEMIKYIGLELEGRNSVYIMNGEYFRGFGKMCYRHAIKILNYLSDKLKGSDINPLLILLEKIHKYLYSNGFGNYKNINDGYDELIKHGSYTNYMNNELLKYFKKENIINKITSEGSIRMFMHYIRDHGRSWHSESFFSRDISIMRSNLIELLTKYKDIILCFSYWYIITYSESKTGFKVDGFIKNNKIEISDIIVNLLRHFYRYTDVGGDYSKCVHLIKDIITSNYNTSIFEEENQGESNECFINFIKLLDQDKENSKQ
jgi:hypothetical protein